MDLIRLVRDVKSPSRMARGEVLEETSEVIGHSVSKGRSA